MTFNLPIPTEKLTFDPISAERQQTLENAFEQLKAENVDLASWEKLGIKDNVERFKKPNAKKSDDVPTVKGITVIENSTPMQTLVAIQMFGYRRKWDPQLDQALLLERYDDFSMMFYSVSKSPSFFVWPRDVLGLQRAKYSEDEILVVQTSTDADEYVSEQGSHSKKRTRATLDLGAWKLTKEGNNTRVEYVFKIHLNGTIPVAVVSKVATDAPMCVGRLRDVFYEYGYPPHLVKRDTVTFVQHIEFEDGDGSKADSGAKIWTLYGRGNGEDMFTIKYDKERMYTSGVNATVKGDGASDVTTEVDAESSTVKVTVGAGANGKLFSVIIKPE